MEEFRKKLNELYTGELAEDLTLGPLLTWKIGGKSRWTAFPASRSEVAALVRLARETKVPWYVIGRGSNILFGDGPFEGLVIYLGRNFRSWTLEPDGKGFLLSADSGISLARLGAIAREHGLTGLESLTFIPGTLGGALITNAEAHKTSIGSLVRKVRILDGEEEKELDASDCAFAYRTSLFEGRPDLVILGADLYLEPGDPEEIGRKTEDARRFRLERQPSGPSAGSVFKNPSAGPAGLLIDRLGFKGRREGDAAVSDVHANFILNEGKATAEEVLRLIREIREVVRLREGIDLELEIKLFNV